MIVLVDEYESWHLNLVRHLERDQAFLITTSCAGVFFYLFVIDKTYY